MGCIVLLQFPKSNISHTLLHRIPKGSWMDTFSGILQFSIVLLCLYFYFYDHLKYKLLKI